MKTLTKLAKQRKSMPVLNAIHATNDNILATDLDTWIIAPRPIDLAPGLYSPHGLLAFKDASAADYPEPFNLGDSIGTVNLQRGAFDNLVWVSKAMSTEEARYYLMGVCFHGNNAIATDGHRLHMARYAAPFPAHTSYPQGIIIPSAAFKLLAELVKEHKAETVRFEFHDKGLRAVVGDSALLTRYTDGTFPDYQRVIPDGAVTAGIFYSRAIKKHAVPVRDFHKTYGGSKSLAVKAYPNGDFVVGDKILGNTSFKPTKECGFNFKYLNDIGISGPAFMNSASDPMRVDSESGERTAVLMPLRV